MATQQETNVTSSTSTFSFSNITNFYTDSEIKVKHVADDGTTTDPVSTSNVDTTNKEVTLSSPVTNGTITVYRETDLTAEDIEFQAGSSIKSVDLNKAQEVLRRGIEEVREQETYQTGAEIKTAYESQANTNAYTDAEKTKLSGLDSSNYLAASHAASGVTSTKITNWDTAHGWGNHASAGYLTSITIADDSIAEVKLDIHNNPSGTDKVLGYTSNGLEWVSQSGGGGGIALTDISVTSNSAGTAALSYDNNSGVFSYTPPDLSGYSGTSHTHSDSAANLTGTTLASGVTASSLTSVGTLGALTVTGTATFNDPVNLGGGSANAITVNGYLTGNSNLLYLKVDSSGGIIYLGTTNHNSILTVDNNGATFGRGITETITNLTDGDNLNLTVTNGTIQTWTLTADRTAVDGLTAGDSMLLMVADGSSYEVTWPTMTWVGGYAPTLATSGYSCIELWKLSSTLYGCHIGDVA